MNFSTRTYRTRLMPIYWAFLVTVLLLPGHSGPRPWYAFPGSDKGVHFALFFLFGWIQQCACPRTSRWNLIQTVLWVGAVTEVLQGEMKMGREMDLWDLIADLVGGGLGIFWAGQYLRKNRSSA